MRYEECFTGYRRQSYMVDADVSENKEWQYIEVSVDSKAVDLSSVQHSTKWGTQWILRVII